MSISDADFIAQASEFNLLCGDGAFNHSHWYLNFLPNAVYSYTVNFLNNGVPWKRWKTEFHPDLAKWAYNHGCSMTAYVVWNSDPATGQPTEGRTFLSFPDSGSQMLFFLRWRSSDKMLRNVNGKTKPFRPNPKVPAIAGPANSVVATGS